MISCDTLVAGAGPAGALAGLELARKGFSVVIADGSDTACLKRTFRVAREGRARVPHKIGESLPGIGLRLLRSLGVDVSDFGTTHTPVGGNLACWASDELDATDFLLDPDGPGWRLSRRRFDATLLSAAIKAGAQFVSDNLDAVERDREHWNCRLKSGEIVESRWLVDATGRSCAVARRLGIRRVRDEGLIALWMLGSPSPGERLERTLIEAVPEGWWYGAVLPDGQAILALHVRPREARVARRDWLDALARTSFIQRFFPPDGFGEGLSVADAGCACLERFHDPNWIACGDAAMSFDPLSSQGIYNAMYSGLSAARAILATDGGDEAALANYADGLARIRTVYQARLAYYYALVKRWPDAPFWENRGR